MKKITKIVCSINKKANAEALIQFQSEFNYFVSQGIPAEQVVKTWNDSQESFYNKVYLVEEYSKIDLAYAKEEFLNRKQFETPTARSNQNDYH